LKDPEVEKAIHMKKDKFSKNSKFEHAISFIRLGYVSTIFAEPGYGAAAKAGALILPYDHVNEFYDEYCEFNSDYRKLDELISLLAGRETFRKVFVSLHNEVRLRGSKGSFETCAICNNLNDVLKSSKLKWTKEQSEIVLKLKRLHLQQRADKRRDSDQRKALAKNTDNRGI
jgi:hypothetical protein